RLDCALAEAAGRPPFDFYGALLSKLDDKGRSMRQRLLTRMGAEAEDALGAFMEEALAAEKRGVRDLECFACHVLLSETEIRREADQASARAGGEIRVMTVHGAKGLEAPIVILPDTAGRKPPHAIALIDDGDGGLLWKPRAKEDCEASRRALEARAAADQDEASRLLYVALTRARDRLIIAGIEGAASQRQGSWRQLAEAAFSTLGADEFELEDGTRAHRFGRAPRCAAAPAEKVASLALPAWCAQPVREEASPPRSLAPSGMVGAGREAALSPLDRTEGLGRWRRGEIIHRLLQILPDLAPDQRRDAARRFLAAEPDLSAEQRAEMAAAALDVVEDPQFAAVFGPGSKAEVALAGGSARLPAGVQVAGRMDRLVVEEDRVLVVDFKTNRPAPARIEDADPAYIRQLATYAGVLSEVFPGRRVETALLWTDGPSLMAVPENLIDAALDGMALIG
ncbi:MAG: 3'-5' exonuclease, partial [Caulobacteraceae bacterium]